MSVRAGDETIATYTAMDGAQTLKVNDRDTGSNYVFAYAPGDADAGGALIDTITGGIRGMMLIVR